MHNRTLHGGEWSTSSSGRLSHREKSACTHWIAGCVGPMASLDEVAKRKSPPPAVRNQTPVPSQEQFPKLAYMFRHNNSIQFSSIQFIYLRV
jgi:hypothetical protein